VSDLMQPRIWAFAEADGAVFQLWKAAKGGNDGHGNIERPLMLRINVAYQGQLEAPAAYMRQMSCGGLPLAEYIFGGGQL
jgi:hypothetical protein